MHLSQLDPQQSDRFSSSHSLWFDLPNGQKVLMLSGIVTVAFRAPGWSNEAAVVNSFHDNLLFDVLLPHGFLAGGQRFRIDQSLPYVGLSHLAGTTNVLWGVNRFAVAADQPGGQVIRLEADLEVARSAELIQQISYSLTLIGELIDDT